MHFWSTCLLWIWTKSTHSNNLNMGQNFNFKCNKLFLSGIYDQMLDCRFGPFSNCPNVYFWCRFKVRLWTKRTFAMHMQHIIWTILYGSYHTKNLQTLFWTENPYVSGETWFTHYSELTSAFLIILDVFIRWEIRVIKVLTLF